MRAGLETTDDAVLGGRLRLLQPRRGHRVGHDAILLAAATGAAAGEHAVDLGAGVGAAGLALAQRVPGLRVTLVERDQDRAALACENSHRNALSDRVNTVSLDIAAAARDGAAAGLPAGCAQRVLMNPPFNDPVRHRASPDPLRRDAHEAPAGLEPWLQAAFRLLAPGGTLTLIWRADDLAAVLALLGRRQAAVALLPVHPRAGEPAIRLLVRARSGSRAPLLLYPGLVLNGADGRPDPAAEAILRGGETLALAEL